MRASRRHRLRKPAAATRASGSSPLLPTPKSPATGPIASRITVSKPSVLNRAFGISGNDRPRSRRRRRGAGRSLWNPVSLVLPLVGCHRKTELSPEPAAQRGCRVELADHHRGMALIRRVAVGSSAGKFVPAFCDRALHKPAERRDATAAGHVVANSVVFCRQNWIIDAISCFDDASKFAFFHPRHPPRRRNCWGFSVDPVSDCHG